VRTPESLRRALGVARVHLVPHHPLKNRHAQLYEVVQRNPFSLFSESMRALYRNQVAGLGPVGAVAVTSARPHDGKTSLSLALAQAASQAGRRVVVVDTDFRQARIDKLFDLVGQPGLADWIAGEATLDTIVYHAPDTEAVPFALVPAGRLTSAALDRFNVDALVELMAGLSPHFDLIVLDTPPLLALSDARVACAAASRVLFVARWGHTTDRDLEAVADIAPIDHTRFACVMTDVDLRKAASSGFHDAYRNYRASQHYYDEQAGLGTGLGTAR
jgi:Mrp family chromosome partitioning ATPase